MELTIRPGSAADAAALSVFAGRTFVDAFGTSTAPEHVSAYIAQAFDERRLRMELDAKETTFLLARLDPHDALVGYTKLCSNVGIPCLEGDNPMQLERIYVDGNVQSRGLGARLLDESVKCSRRAGATHLWLSVWEENEDAQRFYSRHAFEAIGMTHFMLGPDRQNDVVMARAL